MRERKTKDKCVNCKFFKKAYYEDGIWAGVGRCIHEKNKKIAQITAGNYVKSICDYHERIENEKG